MVDVIHGSSTRLYSPSLLASSQELVRRSHIHGLDVPPYINSCNFQTIETLSSGSCGWSNDPNSISTVFRIPCLSTCTFCAVDRSLSFPNCSYGLFSLAISSSCKPVSLAWRELRVLLLLASIPFGLRLDENTEESLRLVEWSDTSFTKRGIIGKQVQRIIVAISARLMRLKRLVQSG